MVNSPSGCTEQLCRKIRPKRDISKHMVETGGIAGHADVLTC